MARRLRVFAPATIANLGPGFDVLGLALSTPGDIVEAELTAEPGVEIVEITGDNGLLTRDPAKNVASRAAFVASSCRLPASSNRSRANGTRTSGCGSTRPFV